MAVRPSNRSWIALSVARLSGERRLRLLMLLGFGLMLGACTKCDVPVWRHGSTAIAPAACYDEPQPQ